MLNCTSFCFAVNRFCKSVNRVFDVAVFSAAPKILEALKIAETYMEKTENFNGKVRYQRYIDIFIYA